MARQQLKLLQRVQQRARGEDQSDVERAKVTLRAFGIGYASSLSVVKHGFLDYEVVTPPITLPPS